MNIMNYYGAKDLAAAFRTVRKNTLIVAEEIPEDKYSYRAAEGTKTVGEMLTHIALGPKFQEQINLVEKRTTMVGFDFMALMNTLKAEQGKSRTKAATFGSTGSRVVELLPVRPSECTRARRAACHPSAARCRSRRARSRSGVAACAPMTTQRERV